MRRLAVIAALGTLLGMSLGVVTTSPALARGPQWELLQAQPFTVPATSCGFEVGVTFPTFTEFLKVLKTSDGSMTFLVTGSVIVTYTNLATGKNITENESGPGTVTELSDGSITFRGAGIGGIFLSPEDAQRFGLPTVGVITGTLRGSVAADGTITSLSLDGDVLVDVCAALS